MKFTTIIYQIGKQDILEKTIDSVNRLLDGNIMYIYQEQLIQQEGTNLSRQPTNSVAPQDMKFYDFVLYIKAGTVLEPEYKDRVLAAFDAIPEPKIGAVYSDYRISTAMGITDMFIASYDRVNWMNTCMECPAIAIRKTENTSLTLSPDMNYFAWLNQAIPIVRIPEHLVTING